MTCVYLGLVPWTTNTTPGRFDEQRFQKGGLKGALVVVVSDQQLGHLTPAIVGLEYLGVSVA